MGVCAPILVYSNGASIISLYIPQSQPCESMVSNTGTRRRYVSAVSLRLGHSVTTAFQCVCRPSAQLSLNWHCIDFESRSLHLFFLVVAASVYFELTRPTSFRPSPFAAW